MNKTIAILLVVLLLGACAAPTTYKPASDGGYGYRESQIADNHYRVAFKMRGSESFDAMDYALLRAAELTLMAGYDWFVVADRHTDGERRMPRSQVGATHSRELERSCGLLGCRTYVRPTTAYSADVSSHDRSATEVILEIRLGKGVRPADAETYDALEVRANLRNRLE